MATIKEAAKKAGVSVGTVSNALTGVVLVSPKRLERIFSVVRDLGYTEPRCPQSEAAPD